MTQPRRSDYVIGSSERPLANRHKDRYRLLQKSIYTINSKEYSSRYEIATTKVYTNLLLYEFDRFFLALSQCSLRFDHALVFFHITDLFNYLDKKTKLNLVHSIYPFQIYSRKKEVICTVSKIDRFFTIGT